MSQQGAKGQVMKGFLPFPRGDKEPLECEQAALPVCWHPGSQSSLSILPHSLSALPQGARGQTAHRRTCTSFSYSTLLTLFSFRSALHLNSETPLTVNLVIYHSSSSHILLPLLNLAHMLMEAGKAKICRVGW